MTTEPNVPPSAFEALRLRAGNAGLSVDMVAGEMGLTLPDPSAPAVLPLSGFLRLQSRLTTLLGDETGRLSKRQLLSGSTELALSRLPARGTLGDAMQIVAQSYNLLHGGAFNQVEPQGACLAFVIDDREFPYAFEEDEQKLFVMETTLLFVHALLRLIVPSAAAGGLRAVELKRPSHPARVPFEEYGEVRYGRARHALSYDGAGAMRVVTFPPPGTVTLEAVTEEQVRLLRGGPDDRTFTGRVRLLIEAGSADQTSVARALGMSVATLRRRLTEEKASFRTLRTEALCSRAKSYLGTDLPLAQIAERLGFSDVRSFSRAFKTWTGETPHVTRKNAHG